MCKMSCSCTKSVSSQREAVGVVICAGVGKEKFRDNKGCRGAVVSTPSNTSTTPALPCSPFDASATADSGFQQWGWQYCKHMPVLLFSGTAARGLLRRGRLLRSAGEGIIASVKTQSSTQVYSQSRLQCFM